MNKFERVFEGMLWESRYIVLAAVIISLVSSIAMYFMATIDAVYIITHLHEYPVPDTEARLQLRSETITHVVELIDGYLLATVLLILPLACMNCSSVKQTRQKKRKMPHRCC